MNYGFDVGKYANTFINTNHLLYELPAVFFISHSAEVRQHMVD